MDWKPGRDMYIGLAMGFGVILAGGWVAGLPLRDLGLWALVFAAVGFAFVQILKHRKGG